MLLLYRLCHPHVVEVAPIPGTNMLPQWWMMAYVQHVASYVKVFTATLVSLTRSIYIYIILRVVVQFARHPNSTWYLHLSIGM
jgi:hypothetical protein